MPPSRRARLAFALAVGAWGAWLAWIAARLDPAAVRDLDPVLFAARALLHGHDPYPLVGPGRAFAFPWGLYYPPPSVFLLLPLAPLPIAAARIVFVGLTSALLGYVLARRGVLVALPVFANVCYLNAVRNAQWSPLLMAASLLPAGAGVLYAVKPNLGLAMLALTDSRRRVGWCIVGGAVLLVVGVVLMPRWPLEWWDAVRDAPQLVVPLRRPGGVLLLLALLRWRRPEARMLAAMACVPATGMWYEALPCFLVSGSVAEGVALALLSLVAFHVAGTRIDPHAASFADQSWVVGNVVLWFVQLPALAMVLRRPNAAPVRALRDEPHTGERARRRAPALADDGEVRPADALRRSRLMGDDGEVRAAGPFARSGRVRDDGEVCARDGLFRLPLPDEQQVVARDVVADHGEVEDGRDVRA